MVKEQVVTTDRTEQDPLGVWPDADDPRDRGFALSRPAAPPPVRVTEPMAILWQGVEYPVADWDMQGLRLVSPMPTTATPGQGRVVDFLLLIGKGETRLSMLVHVRPEPGDDSGCAFQFLHMGRAQSEMLHRIVTAAVSRQELSLTQLLNETHEIKEARKASVAQAQTTRSWFQMGLAGLVIVGAGGALWNNLTTVKARYAAVTALAAQVSVPASGMVAGIGVIPGAQVTEGQVLAHIRPADFDAQREEAATRLRALEAEQADLRQRQRDLATLGDQQASLRASEKEMHTRALSLAENRLSLERAQLDALRATGLPTPERQAARARQQALVLAAEQDVLRARTDLARLEAAEAVGRDVTAANPLAMNTLSPEALAMRLAHLSEEIARGYERDAQMALGLPVLAPCTCTVVQINRTVGEWADPARPMFTLARGDGSSVHALILAEEARGIDQGDSATIRLADGTRLTGTVERLGYDAEWSGFAGLSQSIFAPERYARVEILPDGPLQAPVGMTAQVELRTSDLFGPVLDLLGFESAAPRGQAWQ